MTGSGYKKFAEVHAMRVGGPRLYAAMENQVNGDDQDVAEINWRVQGFAETVEVFANISANHDAATIRFSIDERTPPVDGELVPSMDFIIHVRDEGWLFECGPDIHADEAMALEALNEFVRVAEPMKQEA